MTQTQLEFLPRHARNYSLKSPNGNEFSLNISTEKENSDLEEIKKATKVGLSSKKRIPLAEITTKKSVQPSVVKSKTKRPTKGLGSVCTARSDDGVFTLTRSPADPLAFIAESGSKKRKKQEKSKSSIRQNSSDRAKPVVKKEKLDIKTEFKIPKEPVSLPAKRKSNQMDRITTGFVSVKTEADLSNTTLPLLSTPRDESTPKRPKFNPRPRFCIDDSGDSD